MIVNALWVALLMTLMHKLGHHLAGTRAESVWFAWHSFWSAFLVQVLFHS